MRLDDGEKILFDREVAEDRGFLREISDAEARAAVHGEACDVLAVELDIAAVGADEAGDDVEAGGFTRAVGAEQGDGFAALDREADVAQHGALFIALGEMLGGEAAGHFPDARVRVDFHFGHRAAISHSEKNSMGFYIGFIGFCHPLWVYEGV